MAAQIKQGVESNPILDRLPKHLLQFVKPQDYDHYTSIDQSVWRYVMRKNVRWLQKVAHESYLEGLEKTGISIDHIPSMYGMNRILKKIGWAAVAVDGLIPTRAFLEFQAYNVLVIASEIRSLAEIEYTPIPDIIHESAGHAPIIANPEYAEFLRRLGQLGAKAISSSYDVRLEDAARKLTTLKENSMSSQTEIEQATHALQQIQAEEQPLSEMMAIRNLHWWSVEYGLIGTPNDHRIYGAGLLSSIGESKWCLSDQVRKLPYDLVASHTTFDYTKPQPQLFVTPDFAHLSYILEKYANTMGIRTGGLSAMEKLIDSSELGTIELSTGIQISGVFTRVLKNQRGEVSYFETDGPTALAYREKEMIGHGTLAYPDGFCSPVGRLEGINLAIEDMSPRDLDAYDIYEGRTIELLFEDELSIKGEVVTGIRNLQGKIILIRFKNCLVKFQDEILFAPDQGIYNMVVGKGVTSGFAGPADVNSFDLITHRVITGLPKAAPPDERARLYELTLDSTMALSKTHTDKALEKYRQDWMLHLQMYERLQDNDPAQAQKHLDLLRKIAQDEASLRHLIDDGLSMIEGNSSLT